MASSSPDPRPLHSPGLTHLRAPVGPAAPGSSVPLCPGRLLPGHLPTSSPHSQHPRLTRADDFLDVDPGSLNLSGEPASCPARLLVGVGFCIELGLWDLPRGVVQGQEDGWRC